MSYRQYQKAPNNRQYPPRDSPPRPPAYITDPRTDEEYRAAIAQQQSAYGGPPVASDRDSNDNDNNNSGYSRPTPISRGPSVGPVRSSPSGSVRRTGSSVSSGPTIYAAPAFITAAPRMDHDEAVAGPAIGPSIGPARPPAKKIDPNMTSTSGGGGGGGHSHSEHSSVNPANANLTVRRAGGGQKWEDPTLLSWNPNDFRLFVGNLSGEVTETHLTNAFGKYPSLSKVRVVRDAKSKTMKTKGYGFVAFSDPDDYFRAFKEMNGKYVGGHPVHLKRATTDVKPVKVKASRSTPYQKRK